MKTNKELLIKIIRELGVYNGFGYQRLDLSAEEIADAILREFEVVRRIGK